MKLEIEIDLPGFSAMDAACALIHLANHIIKHRDRPQGRQTGPEVCYTAVSSNLTPAEIQMHVNDPIIFILWLVFLALGCFGPVYTYAGGNRYFAYGGGLFLFIAILMVKLVSF